MSSSGRSAPCAEDSDRPAGRKPADGSHRGALPAPINEQLEAIIRGDGVFRVGVEAGCLVADL